MFDSSGPVHGDAADVVVGDVIGDKQLQQLDGGGEELMHAADAVVPSTSDVQHEAVCRVAKYLSQYTRLLSVSSLVFSRPYWA